MSGRIRKKKTSRLKLVMYVKELLFGGANGQIIGNK